jgi:hypothetical protein
LIYVVNKYLIFKWNGSRWISKNGSTFNSIEEIRQQFPSVKRIPAYGQIHKETKEIDWDFHYRTQCERNPVIIL